ncbi:RING finger protein 43 [Myotis brandtii]|uniref:RING finger protein 43 n=1 Tax=Myotis brandtii TaxID=109478 RepID=S7NYN3_MYOBR|nr:RING finger protein 43 [Myotis brandtii]
MSGGHQLQLAALWPWLLMATLQAGFGRTGLVLAAAVESERSAEQKAIIRVIPLKMDPTGKLNLTLEGVFAGVAEITPAEGKLMQITLQLRITQLWLAKPSIELEFRLCLLEVCFAAR